MLRNLHKLRLLWCPKFWYKLQTAGIKMAFDKFKPSMLDEKKNPVIIMHCIMGNKANWHDFARTVCEHTHRTFYCVDARNHGKSPFTEEHGSQVMAADVGEFVKDHNLKKVSVIGHGMGGRTMMLFGLAFPSLIESAVIVDVSPVAPPNDHLKLDEIFIIMKGVDIPKNYTLAEGREMMAEIFFKIVGYEKAKYLSYNLEKNAKGNFYWSINIDALRNNLRPFSEFRNPLVDKVDPLEKPTMFVCGKHSIFMDFESLVPITHLFPSSTLHWLDAGHLVQMEQPAQLKELVINFLNR